MPVTVYMPRRVIGRPLGKLSLWLLRIAGYDELAFEDETEGRVAALAFRLGRASCVAVR